MDFEPISDAVYELLMRQGLRSGTAGTVDLRGKDAGRAIRGTRPATTSRGGGAAVGWEIERAIEAAIRNGTGRIVRYVPLLMIVLEGGRR